MLVSKKASPALKRLSLRLTFGVHVVAPTLGSPQVGLETEYDAHTFNCCGLTISLAVPRRRCQRLSSNISMKMHHSAKEPLYPPVLVNDYAKQWELLS